MLDVWIFTPANCDISTSVLLFMLVLELCRNHCRHPRVYLVNMIHIYVRNMSDMTNLNSGACSCHRGIQNPDLIMY